MLPRWLKNSCTQRSGFEWGEVKDQLQVRKRFWVRSSWRQYPGGGGELRDKCLILRGQSQLGCFVVAERQLQVEMVVESGELEGKNSFGVWGTVG